MMDENVWVESRTIYEKDDSQMDAGCMTFNASDRWRWMTMGRPCHNFLAAIHGFHLKATHVSHTIQSILCGAW